VTIRFRCPTCKKRLVSANRKIGRDTQCPACGGAVTVPLQWFLLVDGTETGPYSREKLKAEAATGTISPCDRAREANKLSWVEVGRLPFLADAFPIEPPAVEVQAPHPVMEPVISNSLGYRPRKASRLLPLLAGLAALVIVGVPLTIALVSYQAEQKPDIVAQAQSRRPIPSRVREPEPDTGAPAPAHQQIPDKFLVNPGYVSRPEATRAPEPTLKKESTPSRGIAARDQAPTPAPEQEPRDNNPHPTALVARDASPAATPDPAPTSTSPPAKTLAPEKSTEPAFQPPSWLPTRRVAATVMYKLRLSSPSSDHFQLSFKVPQTFAGRQVIREMTFNPDPVEVSEKDGDRIAHFELSHPSDGAVIYVRLVADLYEADLTTANQLPTRLRRLAIPDRDRWLRDEPLIETNDPLIVQAAKTAAGNNEIQMITAMLNGMALRMTYEAEPGELGAVGLLKAGCGKCADFANLFVALCRAKHIPARPCNGFTTKPVTKGTTPFHRWAEVYLRGYGWVPVDPTWARDGHHPWETMEPVRVYISYDQLTYQYLKQKGPVNIEPTVKVASDLWVKPNARVK
jgi:transglutaminase-like putative cysteine protease